MSAVDRRGHSGVIAAVAGGALLCVGAASPWISLFAGLQSFSGLVGLYGRILFLAGALAVLGGAAMFRRDDRWLHRILGVLGVASTLFVAWLLVGLHSTTTALSNHATLVARPGAGLFIALAGAMLLATLVFSAATTRRDETRSDLLRVHGKPG